MNNLNYELHQLKINSNIAIVDLERIDNFSYNYDILVIASEIEKDFIFSEKSFVEIKEDYFYISVKDIATYELKENNIIEIKYHPESTPEEISLFLLGSCLGIILFQKGFLPLHASSIYLQNKGVVFFTGDSGAGKSTTLNAFLQKGYKMISDDVSAIKIDEKPMVYPSFPRAKIWQDSADKLNINTEKLSKVRRDFDKYSYLVSKEQFHNQLSEPYILYEINKYDGDKVYIEEVEGMDIIKLLYKNTYRVEYLKYLKKNKEHFSQITTLAKYLKIKRVFRPETKNSINQLVDLIEADITKT